IDRSTPTSIVETSAKGACSYTRIVNGDPTMGGQDVIGGERIFRGAVAASVESIYPEPIIGNLDRNENRVCGGDQRGAVMGKVSGVQINRRGPVNSIQVLGRGLIDSGVMSVACKGGNARGLARGISHVAAICSHQKNH